MINSEHAFPLGTELVFGWPERFQMIMEPRDI